MLYDKFKNRPELDPQQKNPPGARPKETRLGGFCRKAYYSGFNDSSLLPLDRSRGFGGDVVDDTVDVFDFVDDAHGDFLQHVPRDAFELAPIK